MNYCAKNIEGKLCEHIKELQPDFKAHAMALITELNEFLKIKKSWDNLKTATNFKNIHHKIWWVNRQIATFMNDAYKIENTTHSDNKFFME